MSAGISQEITRKMRDKGVPDDFIEVFLGHRARALGGDDGEINETDLLPVPKLINVEDLAVPTADQVRHAIKRTVLIKLNGGLGTSMGLEKPKSLLPVKGDLTFLDIIVQQAVRDQVPLILMNSAATVNESLAAVENRVPANDEQRIPYSFLQHQQPKLTRSDLAPVSWPESPEDEWCPPGHGDLYVALKTSSMLDRLLDAGFEYAFVSNADNLGAVIDDSILGHFAQSYDCPFLMEVADRTEMDRKGGHLAVRKRDQQLILRESAQCPGEDSEAFEDFRRHRFFNTNNLWLKLRAVRELLDARNNQLGLPLIRNPKPVDPRDPGSTPIYQLETAMGSAIEVFEGAQAVRVPRRRFAPVKTTNELLLVRSDAYVLDENGHLIPDPRRQAMNTVVKLDSRYYRFIDDLDKRFPFGPPSLAACTNLTIEGDVRFGRDVVCRGRVQLVAPDGLLIGDRETIGTDQNE